MIKCFRNIIFSIQRWMMATTVENPRRNKFSYKSTRESSKLSALKRFSISWQQQIQRSFTWNSLWATETRKFSCLRDFKFNSFWAARVRDGKNTRSTQLNLHPRLHHERERNLKFIADFGFSASFSLSSSSFVVSFGLCESGLGFRVGGWRAESRIGEVESWIVKQKELKILQMNAHTTSERISHPQNFPNSEFR